MPVQTPTTNERVTREQLPEKAPAAEDDAVRTLAQRHLEHVRKFKLYLFVYVLSVLVLTPVWIITQYETSPGWVKHLSTRSRNPGDWDPWLIWVVLIGAVIVAIAGYRVYADRSDSPAELEREVERLKVRR